MKLALCSLFCLTALFAACERVEVSASNLPDGKAANGEESAMLSTPSTGQTLFDRIANSRRVTAFQGIRRVELFLDEGPVEHHTVLRERVSADGHGAFAIEALEVVEPPMSRSQNAVFLALQSLRQGLNWRYRDFSIDAVDLFLQNYRATDTGYSGSIAGQPVLELRVERVDQSGSIHTLLVHAHTGLVLQAREESQEGVLLSEMSYETLDLSPDLSGVAWHQMLNSEQPLPINGSLLASVGFEPLVPRSLPCGFQLAERSRVTDTQSNTTWVKFTYTDGVESLFFLSGGPLLAGNGINSGVPEIQADLVEVTVATPWLIARGDLHSQRVIALGKLSEGELLGLLRSALE